MSLPRPPMTVSSPALPLIRSSPSPPLIVRLTRPAFSLDASIVSLPPRPLMTSESLAPSACAIVTCAASPLTTTDAPLLTTLMLIVAGRAIDGHGVRRAVTGGAAERPRQVDRNLGHVGSGQIIDRDGVGTTQRIEMDVLDTVEIHGDVGDVAGELAPGCRWQRC